MSTEPNNIFSDIPPDIQNQVNPYINKLINAAEQQSLPVSYGKYLKDKKGNWRSFFQSNHHVSPRNLYLEIGIHKGKVFRMLAQDHPKDCFVGIDLTYKRCILSAQKINAAQIPNAHIIQGNANYLDSVFAPEELDGVIVFFPDPWNKKRKQTNNRLLSKEFCEKLLKLIKKNGFMWIKTDCPSYHTYLCENMKALSATQMKTPPFSNNYESTFEQRFKELQMPIYETLWTPQN